MSEILPFEGMKPVDFTHVLAGPAYAYYFGLLGAEVIKIETPILGDAIRNRGGTDPVTARSGMSTPYLTQAAGKKSVCLDLESPKGNRALHALLQDTDIFLENHVPMTMQRLSLDNETVTKRHKHLI